MAAARTNAPLHILAKRDDVVFVVMTRELADAMRDFGPPVQVRLERDKFDGRLRHLVARPAVTVVTERRPRKRHRVTNYSPVKPPV